MPIEGDLKSLNLSSILQLIAQEGLTGVLKIKKRNELADIGIYESQITGAFYERGDKADRLEDYLVRSGLIKKNLYDMITEIHQETKRPIMNIIIEDKYLTVDEIERIIRFKIQEVLDELFTWQEGEFKFEQGAVIYPKSMLKIRLNIESLVLEAARRFDEWPKIAKAVTSGDLVYKKVERPELKLRLSDDEDRVINLLDGNRCVDDLVEMSGLGKFHTYACLYHLLTSGQIDVAYAKPRAEPARLKHKRPIPHISLKFLKTPTIILIIVIGIIIEIMIGNALSTKHTFNFSFFTEVELATDYKDFQKIFYYRYNRMPGISEIQTTFDQ